MEEFDSLLLPLLQWLWIDDLGVDLGVDSVDDSVITVLLLLLLWLFLDSDVGDNTTGNEWGVESSKQVVVVQYIDIDKKLSQKKARKVFHLTIRWQ